MFKKTCKNELKHGSLTDANFGTFWSSKTSPKKPENHRKTMLGRSWDALWELLGRSWIDLARFGPLLGASCAILGTNMASLSCQKLPDAAYVLCSSLLIE